VSGVENEEVVAASKTIIVTITGALGFQGSCLPLSFGQWRFLGARAGNLQVDPCGNQVLAGLVYVLSCFAVLGLGYEIWRTLTALGHYRAHLADSGK
jgi:hypothetical protein